MARPVSVVIPAHREADGVGTTVAAALRLPGVAEVVVVDDGSPDATAKAAEAAGARVVRLRRRRGKGGALSAGLDATSAEILLFLDADLGASALAAARLIAPVVDGRADMAVAALPPAGPSGGFGAAVRLARAGIRALTGITFQAPLSGQRALTRQVLEAAWPLERGWGVEVGLTVDALRAGFRVIEVPCPMGHRARGRSWGGFAHRARQAMAVARALAARLRPRPAGPRPGTQPPRGGPPRWV